jgi:hypothetical protein
MLRRTFIPGRQERSGKGEPAMKKQKELKKLRIGKETLLPLGSRQIEKLAAGYPISPVGHLATTTFVHPPA